MAAIPQVQDTLTNWDSNHNSPTASGTITVAGGNTLLLALMLDEDAGAIAGVSSDVDGALTNLDENLLVGLGCAIWYKKGATVGDHVLTPSYDDTNDETTVGLALALSDVDQSASTFNTVAKADGSSTSPSVTATTASDELVVDVMGVDTSADIITSVGADQTAWDADGNPGGGVLRVIGSYQDGANGGVMSYGLSESRQWIQMAVSIRGEEAATATTPRLVDGGLVNKGSLVNRSLVNTPMKRVRRIWKKSNRIFVPAGIQLQGAR